MPDPTRTLATLAALAALAAAPAAAGPPVEEGGSPAGADIAPPPTAPAATAILDADGERLIVTAPPLLPWPGERFSVYLSEARPDPRSGVLVEGWRYAGDGRVVWSGAGVVELALEHPLATTQGGAVVLRAPLGASPTAAWVAPGPPAEVPAPPLVEVLVAGPPEVERPPLVFATGRDRSGAALGTVHDAPMYQRPTALRVSGGFAGDGFGSGVGLGAASWRLRPTRGPGLVEVGVEGIRGQRWLEGEGDEGYGLEPAVGYRVWSRLDTPGQGLALIGGVGAGVGAEGLALSGLIGVRTGHPDASRIETTFEARGGLGNRLTLDGRLAMRDALRLGARTRIGDLPRHDGALRQLRADGALVLAADLGPAVTLELAGGAGGYDLLRADAGIVADGALEVRW